MHQECYFFIEINAPKGLAGIEKHLDKCKLSLKPYLSGYNNKVILKNDMDDDRFEWGMDSSDTDVMVASGYICMPVASAWKLLKSLSFALTAAGFPHKIGLDDEEGNKKYSCSFLWEK